MANWYDDPNALPLESEVTPSATVNPNPLLSAYQRGLAGLNPDGTPVAPSPALPSALPNYAGTPGVLQGLNQYLAQKPEPLSPEAQAKANEWIKNQSAPQSLEKPAAPLVWGTDTLAAAKDWVTGLSTTIPASYYRLAEDNTRPDQYSPEAKAAFAADEQLQQQSEAERVRREKAGEATQLGSAIRSAIPSSGFSLGSMAAAIPAGLATGAATQAALPMVPGAGLVGGLVGSMGGSGVAAFRMQRSMAMDGWFKAAEQQSMEKNKRPLTEPEKQQLYAALDPLATDSGLWEAGPEAIGNAATVVGGGVALGFLGRKALERVAGGAMKKAAIRAGAAAFDAGTEFATETSTQLGQATADARAQAVTDAIVQGRPVDPAAVEAATSTYNQPGGGGVVQAFKDIAAPTLGTLVMFGLAGGAVKGGQKTYERLVTNPQEAQAILEMASNPNVLAALPKSSLMNLEAMTGHLQKKWFQGEESRAMLDEMKGNLNAELTSRSGESADLKEIRQQTLKELWDKMAPPQQKGILAFLENENPGLTGYLETPTDANAHLTDQEVQALGQIDVRGLRRLAPALGLKGAELKAAQQRMQQPISTATPPGLGEVSPGTPTSETPSAEPSLNELGFGPPTPPETSPALPTPPADQGIADPQELERKALERKALARKRLEEAWARKKTPESQAPTPTPLPTPSSGNTIQLQRGESIELTPPKPGEPIARVTATPEEEAKLRGLMGERQRRTPQNTPTPESSAVPSGLGSIEPTPVPDPIVIGNHSAQPVTSGTASVIDAWKQQKQQLEQIAQRNTPADRAADLLSQIPGRIGEQQRIAQEGLKPRPATEPAPEIPPAPAAPQPQPENPHDSRSQERQAEAASLLNQEPSPPAAKVAGEVSPAKIQYPNRKLKLDEAITDFSDEFNSDAWANVALANMNSGEVIKAGNKQGTVKKITNNRITISWKDGDATKDKIYFPGSANWGQLVRDLGGSLAQSAMERQSPMRLKQISGQPEADVSGQAFDALLRDPAFRYDPQERSYRLSDSFARQPQETPHAQAVRSHQEPPRPERQEGQPGVQSSAVPSSRNLRQPGEDQKGAQPAGEVAPKGRSLTPQEEADPFAPATPEERQATQRKDMLADPDFQKAMVDYRDRIGYAVKGERFFTDGKFIGSQSYVPHPDNAWWDESKGLRQAKGLSEAKVRAALTKFNQGEAPADAGETTLLDFLVAHYQQRQSLEKESAWIEDQLTPEETELLNRLTAELAHHPDFGADRLAEFLQEVSRKYTDITPAQFDRALIKTYEAKLDALRKAQSAGRSERAAEGSPSPARESDGAPVSETPLLKPYTLEELDAENAEVQRKIAEDEARKDKAQEDALRDKEQKAFIRDQQNRFAPAGMDELLPQDDLLSAAKEAPKSEAQKQKEPEKAPTDSAAIPEVAKDSAPLSGFVDLAHRVKSLLLSGSATPLTSSSLFKMADAAFGGTQAQGTYNSKDAYDAMELGVNLALLEQPMDWGLHSAKPEALQSALTYLEALQQRLPTQSKRDEEQIAMQQFSTPHVHAHVVAWVANLAPTDVVLEPTAGTGNLVTHAQLAHPQQVIANELSERRSTLLKEIPGVRTFIENANHLNAVLPADVKPTVVVMNPPFSADIHKVGKKDLMVAAKQIEQALARLQPNGRLVAIVGRGMSFDAETFKDWWNTIQKNYRVLANIAISGKEYTKFGTSFDNRILVIDKTGQTGLRSTIVEGDVAKVADLIPLLEAIRHERVHTATPAGQSQPASDASPQGAIRPGSVPAPGVNDQGDGTGTVGRAVPAAPVGTRRSAGRADAVGEDVAPRGAAISDGKSGESRTVRAAHGERDGRDEPQGVGAIPAVDAEGQPAGIGDHAQPAEPVLEIENRQAPAKESAALSEKAFEGYQPEATIKGAKPHPTPLVESAAMSAVRFPPLQYIPNLPIEVVESGALSAAQLEAIAYAGQAHSQLLPNGERRGYFIGDSTGVGKGAEIAGMILDNWRNGRKKAVWVSENGRLFPSAQRDADWVGLGKEHLFQQGAVKGEIQNKEGILYTTYATLRSAEKGDEARPGLTRLDQLVNWLGKDFDGVIAFDEAHNMGNATDSVGSRGRKEASAAALAGVDLQKRLPNARVVYVSATGATEVDNLVYAQRLGLWGEGTAFADAGAFVNKISSGGLAAMEVVAKDMKSFGLYTARSLSWDGVKVEPLLHSLSPEQARMYDDLARSWQIVLQDIHAAMKDSGSDKNGMAKGQAMGAFWGAHQRFFNAILTSLSVPSLIKDVEAQITAGHSVVMQLVNTNEATQERRKAQAVDAGLDLSEVDITPRDILMQYLQNSFPTALYEEYTDENGNLRTRPVTDSSGKAVQNPAAVARRDALMEKLGALSVPEGVLEQVINHFGSKAVAEITGRKSRLVRQPDGKVIEEKLSPAKSNADANAFDNDDKRILVFSDAGGTGRSYHADRRFKNQRLRVHYLVQPGWRADKAIQGLGRTHRTNQAQPPLIKTVTTNIKSQLRFVSSIARRMDQMGALTKGQRDANSQGMFEDDMNLENRYSERALETLFSDIRAGRVDGVTLQDIENQMGIRLVDNNGNFLTDKIPTIQQFLNRLLSLDLEMMERVFDAFDLRRKANIEYAKQNGNYDAGMETLKALSIVQEEEKEVARHSGGGTTQYVKLVVEHENRFIEYGALSKDAIFARNRQSGKLYAFEPAISITNPKTGEIIERSRRFSPYSAEYKKANEVYDANKYEILKGADAQKRKAWEQAIKDSPQTSKETIHLITGALLPVWDRLDQASDRVIRTKTDQGKVLIGRQVKGNDIAAVLKRLGVQSDAPQLTAQQALDYVMQKGATLVLSNDWKIERRIVNNQARIELVGVKDFSDINLLKNMGAFAEVIQFRTRVFLPTDRGDILERLIKSKPIIEVLDKQGAPITLPKPQASRTPAPASGLTRTGFMAALQRRFPHLSEALNAMLARGEKNQKGGLVLINSNDLDAIAKVFAEKTGRSLESAKQEIQASRRRIAVAAERGQEIDIAVQALFGTASNRDTEYLAAVERGDLETAQRMVTEAAKAAGVNTLPDDTANVGYRARRSPVPKKTVKVYKAFRMRDGKLYPMFVGAKDDLPIGVWLDATEGGYHFTGDNGREYIPADTGVSTPIPNDAVRDELLKRGYIKSPTAKSIKVVAYRPGWHGGELPFFPQAGNKVVHKGKKLIPNAPDGYAYPNVHEYDTVIAEVEMDADRNYKQEYIDTAERNADGSINKQKSGLRFVPKGGFYEYATNPLFADRPELGKWFISGSVKITRILSQQETNAKLDALNVPRQAWNASKDSVFDVLNLDRLGYDPQFNHTGYKLLDPVTRDDAGNVIPLSQRFDKTKQDVRFSKGGVIQGLYDPQTGLVFAILPNLSETSAPGVFLHENVHAQDRADINARAVELVNPREPVKRPELRALLNRVQARLEASSATNDPKEVSAYLIEELAATARLNGMSAVDGKFMDWVDRTFGQSVGDWVRSVVKALRGWAFRHGFLLKASSLSLDDLLAWAEAGVQRTARGEVKLAGRGDSLFSRNLTADELLAQVQAGQVEALTSEQWAQVQQAFLQQATSEVSATGTQAPSFKAWFGASRIKNKAGQPLVMYHATDAEFTVFDAAQSGQNTTHPTAALGFFFTNDRDHAAAKYGNNVMEVYLAIENPYAMTDADLRKIETVEEAKAFRQKLEAQGYDGIVMPAETRTRYVAAFHADQIKRTENATYTRGEKDIRFSQPQTPAPVGVSASAITQSLIQPKLAAWNEAGLSVEVVQSVADLPADLQKAISPTALDVLESSVNEVSNRSFPKPHARGNLQTGVPVGDQLNSGVNIPIRSTGIFGLVSNALQIFKSSGRANTKAVGNIFDSNSLIGELFDSLSVDRQLEVMNIMRSSLHNFEVFRSIVSSIPVDMMNDLSGIQLSSQLNHRDHTMFQDGFSAKINVPVFSGDIRLTKILLFSAFNSVAGNTAKFPVDGHAFSDGKISSTSSANHGYRHDYSSMLSFPIIAKNNVEGFYDVKSSQVYLVADNLASLDRAKEVLSHEVIGHWASHNLRAAPEFVQILKALNRLEAVGNQAIVAIAAQVDATQPGLDRFDRAEEIYSVAIERGLHEKIGLLRTWSTKLLQQVKAWLRKLGFEGRFVNDITLNDVMLWAKESQRRLDQGGRGSYGKWALAGSRGVSTSFAGEKAQTADLSLLQQAKLRVEQGEDAEQVRQDTGWHQGADAKWRFEIDDSRADWKIPFAQIPESELFKQEHLLPLTDVLDHPELFAAYPQLEKITVVKRAGLFDFGGLQGWFNNDTLELGLTPYAKDPLSTLLHEVQHVVQMYEGFAKGGNENSVWQALPQETKENIAKSALEKLNKKATEFQEAITAVDVMSHHPDLIKELHQAENARDYAYAVYKQYKDLPKNDKKRIQYTAKWMKATENALLVKQSIVHLLGFESLSDLSLLPQKVYSAVSNYTRILTQSYPVATFTATFQEPNAAIKDYVNSLNQDLANVMDEMAKIKSGDEEAIRKQSNLFEFYKKLAGETEARLTQARQRMTADERRTTSPKSMQEYSDEDQIIVDQDGSTAMSVEEQTETEKQMAAVRAQYEGTDQWMKAPNGQPTKLNERQWLQTRTPNFLAWFGNWIDDPKNASQVVDKNGEPLVYYRMTDSDRTEFRKSWRGGLIYFAATAKGAELATRAGGGVTYPVFLNAKNIRGYKGPGVYFGDAEAKGYEQKLIKNGFDAIKVRDEASRNGGTLAVLDPDQIKSAIANTGEFSPTNPDIRFSRALPPNQYEDAQGGVQDSRIFNPISGREELKDQRAILQRLREDGVWKTLKTVAKESRPAWLKLLTLQQKVEMLQDNQILKDLATFFENTALAMDADKSNLKQEAFALAEEMRSEIVKARDKGYLLGRIMQWSSLRDVMPGKVPERNLYGTTAEFVQATEDYQRLMGMVEQLETQHPTLLALYDKIMGKGTIDAQGQHQPNMIERMDGLYRTALQERLGRQALMFLNATLESAQDTRQQTLWQHLHTLAQNDPTAYAQLQQTYQNYLGVVDPTPAQLTAWRDSLSPEQAVLWDDLLVREGQMRNRKSLKQIQAMVDRAVDLTQTPRAGTLTAALRALHTQNGPVYDELRNALKLRLERYQPNDDRHADIKSRLPLAAQPLFEQIVASNNAAIARLSFKNKLNTLKTAQPKPDTSLAGRLHTLYQQSPDRFAALSQALTARLQTLEMNPAEVDALRQGLPETDQALFDEITADMQAKVQPGLTALRELYESRRRSGPYFPLDRFGPYQVYAERAGNGKDGIGLPAFSTFETEAEQQRAVQIMQAEGWTVRTNYQIRDALETTAPPNSFIKKLFNQIDQTAMLEAERQTLKNDIYQMYLQSLPELSARKHFMKRKGIPGFSGDALRSFAQLMNSKANAIARLRYSDHLANSLEAMEKASKALGQDPTKLAEQNRARMIVAELKDSYGWMMNPSNATWANRLTSLGFFWYLTNLSTSLVNLTQVPIMTFPELGAKFGATRTFAVLNKTIADYGVWKLRRGEPGRKLYEKLRGEFNGELGLDLDRIDRDGIATRTQSVTLAGMGEDAPEFKGGTAGTLAAGWKWVFDKMSLPFHYSEVANREITFIAAYRLARTSEQAQAINDKMTTDGATPNAINDAVRNYAYEIARNTVLKTQGNFANFNRAPFMRNNFARVAFLFRSFSQFMTWRWLRDTYQLFKSADETEKQEVKKRLGLMLASSFLWGGAMGLPIYTVVMSLAGLLFGNDPDDPYDPEMATKQALQGLLGETAQQVLMGGAVGQLPKLANIIPGLNVTGIDLSPRVSADLVRLWMRRMPGDLEGESAWDWYVTQAMGPLGGMGRNAFRAYGDLINSAQGGGSLFRALEGTMPAPIRNALKAARFEQEGVTTRRGDLLVPDMNWAMMVQQALGFTPDVIAAQYAQNTARYEFKDALAKRRKGLTDRYIYAIHEQDSELRQETLDFIKKFNRLNPEAPITAQALKSAIKNWTRARALSEGGVYEPSRGMRARLKREFPEVDSED